MHKRLLVVFLLTAACAMQMLAGNTGKIAGKVRDIQTGEELIGANVVIEGTSMGAATNVDGYYVILNIPPGKYKLFASAVGYNRKPIEGISVSIDLTTTIDFQMQSTVLEVKDEVVVTAQKPVVQRDLTAKTAVVGTEQISALPVTEVSQVLNLQAGYVAGSLRGGRKGEVAYWVDGVPVTDVYDGNAVVEVNKNLVQELQLVSGAFNAEYGQAMSGIVNIATKEGGTKFSGGVGAYVGDYVSTSTDLFPFIDNPKITNIRNFEGNISGPIIGSDLTFFANARFIHSNGWRYGLRRYNPWNIVSAVDTVNDVIVPRDPAQGQRGYGLKGLGDGAVVPMNWSERKYGQGKLTWHVTGSLKASLNYIYDNTTTKRTNDQDLYFYNPDGIGNDHSISNTGILQITHTLSSRTFYTIGGSFFESQKKYYVYENIHDPLYTHPRLFDRLNSYSFYTGGTDLNRFKRSTRTLLGKLDVSSQLDESNLIKVGAEVNKHRVQYENYSLQPIISQTSFDPVRSSPFITTEIPDQSSLSYSSYLHNPLQLSGYIQDKMEFKDFILNIGFRVDYFDPDGVVLADQSDPNIYYPIKSSNAGETLEQRRAHWYKKASTKVQVSPRIGASFPITAQGVVHFSYGHFFQIPRFERLYENPDFKIGLGTGNQGIVGNADLKPEQTIKGEIGIQQQLSDDVSVDVTAYLSDIRNLTTTGADQISVFGGSTTYSRYQNKDFGTVKGIILEVNKRFAGGFTAMLYYTYQVAKGSGSNPDDARNAITGGTLPEVQLTPLGWDQRHTLNVTATYAAKNWGLSLISQYGSGTPYTPRRATDVTALLTNSQLKPAFFQLDLQGYYEIPLDPIRLVAFARIFNVLDIRNEVNVFDDTGRASFTTDEATARNSNTLQVVNTLDEWFRRPNFWSEPRRVELGLNLEF